MQVIEGENGAKQLVITVECPQAATVGEIDLHVSATEIQLDAEVLYVCVFLRVCMCVCVCVCVYPVYRARRLLS
jgi:ABC-type lipoprotein release transport system permease subunit